MMLRSNTTYRGNVWELRGSYTNVGQRFNDEMGYVPRVGITKKTAFFSPHIRIPALSGCGEYAFNDWFITGRTNPSRPFSFNGRYAWGNFYDGSKRGYQAGFGARFGEQLSITGSLSRNVISLPDGAFTTNLVSSRIVYSFTTSMFLNALIQYNTDAYQWSSNIRFNIIHHPLSDFFLVYNDQRDSRTNALTSRAVIAKVTQMLAF